MLGCIPLNLLLLDLPVHRHVFVPPCVFVLSVGRSGVLQQRVVKLLQQLLHVGGWRLLLPAHACAAVP